MLLNIANIEAVQQIDFFGMFVSLLILIVAFTAVVTIIDKFAQIIGKPISWLHRNNKDHEKLESAIKEMSEIKESNREMAETNINLACAIEKVSETVEKISNTQEKIETRVDDNDLKTELIQAAMVQQMADRINQKVKYYLREGEIPEDEMEEFVNMYESFMILAGENHNAIPQKFKYVINKLPMTSCKYGKEFFEAPKTIVNPNVSIME